MCNLFMDIFSHGYTDRLYTVSSLLDACFYYVKQIKPGDQVLGTLYFCLQLIILILGLSLYKCS